MVEHHCPKCNRPFSAPSKVRAHLARKTDCLQGAYRCSKCDRCLASRQSRWTHEQTCTGKNETPDELRRNNQLLSQALAAVQPSAPAQFIQNIQNVQQVNLTVTNVVVNVGDEDCSHIDTSLAGLEASLGIGADHEQALLNFCRLLRCDPSVPQNHNIKVFGPDDPVAQRGNGEWKMKDANSALLFALDCDARCLSSKIVDTDDLESRPDLHAFKYNYLLHDIQRKCSEDDVYGLSSTLQSLKELLHDFTKSTSAKIDSDVAGPTSDLAVRVQLRALDMQKLQVIQDYELKQLAAGQSSSNK